MVAELIEQKTDATLEELVIQVEQIIGVRLSRATRGRVVVKLKITRKKNFARDRATDGTSATVASAILA